MGGVDEALERYREALVIAEANDLRMQIGELLARLGGVAPDRQRRMEYLQRALTVFRELGAQSQMRSTNDGLQLLWVVKMMACRGLM